MVPTASVFSVDDHNPLATSCLLYIPISQELLYMNRLICRKTQVEKNAIHSAQLFG